MFLPLVHDVSLLMTFLWVSGQGSCERARRGEGQAPLLSSCSESAPFCLTNIHRSASALVPHHSKHHSAFISFRRDLEKKEREEKEREREERKRGERRNRDAFKDLLAAHRREGVINAKTRWKVRGRGAGINGAEPRFGCARELSAPGALGGGDKAGWMVVRSRTSLAAHALTPALRTQAARVHSLRPASPTP